MDVAVVVAVVSVVVAAVVVSVVVVSLAAVTSFVPVSLGKSNALPKPMRLRRSRTATASAVSPPLVWQSKIVVYFAVVLVIVVAVY